MAQAAESRLPVLRAWRSVSQLSSSGCSESMSMNCPPQMPSTPAAFARCSAQAARRSAGSSERRIVPKASACSASPASTAVHSP